MNQPIHWSPGVTLEDIEKQVILKAFRFYQNNKTTTSNALGIAIRTLDHKLEKYKNDDEQRVQHELERKARADDFLARQRGPEQRNINQIEAEERAKMLHGADAGVHVESASQATAQQAMPVPESKKVQEVLQRSSAQGGARRAR